LQVLRLVSAGKTNGAIAAELFLSERTIERHLSNIFTKLEAAAESGAEIREGFAVDEILIEGGRAVGIRGHSKHGGSVVERADLIIGAGGRRSIVADAARPEQYDEKPPLLAAYYTYWSGLPMDGQFETYIRDKRGFAAAPTHGDLTLVIAGWPYAELAENRKDIEGNYLKTIRLAPAFADRLRGARREARFAGAAVPNYFRKPYGPGWAGILDEFRDAELCADAIDAALSGTRPFEDAMGDYHRTRDAQVKAMYDFTCELATLGPPPPDVQRLLGAVHGNRKAMDDFARMNAGTISPAEFFATENVDAIAAAAVAGSS
jgi:flavin-dependent dehydrogenase